MPEYMAGYSKYKYSGFSWIGDIPEHWDIKRTKYVAKLYNGDSLNDEQKNAYSDFSESDETIPYIASKDIDKDSCSVDYLNGTRIPKKEKNTNGRPFSKAPAGSSLLCIEGGSAGKKRCILDREVNFVNKLCCFVPKINGKFLFYYICSNSYWENFKQNLQGMIGGVTITKLGTFPIPIPTDSEQKAISDYLDTECGKIDHLIKTIGSKVELLKESKLNVITNTVLLGNSSGLNNQEKINMWKTQVSADRYIIRLKYLIRSIIGGVSVNAEQVPADSGEIGVLKTSCVSQNVFLPNENKRVIPEELKRVKCPVKGNTVIVSRMNTPELVGAAGFVERDFDNLFLPDRLWEVSFDTCRILPKFAWYFLISKYAKNYYTSLSTGTSGSMQNISKGQFENILIPLPTLEEQRRLIQILELECGRYDAAIDKANSQIDILKEYKQSLITEVVTGKRKVC